jgi:hypothetical protein
MARRAVSEFPTTYPVKLAMALRPEQAEICPAPLLIDNRSLECQVDYVVVQSGPRSLGQFATPTYIHKSIPNDATQP